MKTNMKPNTYKKYTEITPKEALLALAENDGKPINGYAFTSSSIDGTPYQAPLISCIDGLFLVENGRVNDHCYKVEEINPRDVPSGVTPFSDDKPWLAYVPQDQVFESKDNWYSWGRDKLGWRGNQCGDSVDLGLHYAIDVRTGFAAEHFPQIVACFDLESLKESPKWKVGDTVEVIDGTKTPLLNGDKGHVVTNECEGHVVIRVEGGCSHGKEHFMRPRNLKAWDRNPRYGYTDDGHKIVAPEGWEIVPEGESLRGFKVRNCWGNGDICEDPHFKDDWRVAECYNDSRAYIRQIDPIAKGHNPDKLTVSQVGEGYRLLEVEEIGERDVTDDIEGWSSDRWHAGGWRGASLFNIYRTRKPAGYFLPEPQEPDWKAKYEALREVVDGLIDHVNEIAD